MPPFFSLSFFCRLLRQEHRTRLRDETSSKKKAAQKKKKTTRAEEDARRERRSKGRGDVSNGWEDVACDDAAMRDIGTTEKRGAGGIVVGDATANPTANERRFDEEKDERNGRNFEWCEGEGWSEGDEWDERDVDEREFDALSAGRGANHGDERGGRLGEFVCAHGAKIEKDESEEKISE